MNEPEYPSEALLASIQHEGEKLGYLVAQVEQLFASRVKYERHVATVAHAKQAGAITLAFIKGELPEEQASEQSAVLSVNTSDTYDEIKAVYQSNLNRLNQMVVDAINAGKQQAFELDQTLDQILKEGETNA
jgi:hypothetical protein